MLQNRVSVGRPVSRFPWVFLVFPDFPRYQMLWNGVGVPAFPQAIRKLKILSENEYFLIATNSYKCRTVIDFMFPRHSQKWWNIDTTRDLTNHCKPKAITNQVCVLGTFWVDAWRPNAPKGSKSGSHFWDHFWAICWKIAYSLSFWWKSIWFGG